MDFKIGQKVRIQSDGNSDPRIGVATVAVDFVGKITAIRRVSVAMNVIIVRDRAGYFHEIPTWTSRVRIEKVSAKTLMTASQERSMYL